jgi:hypothetical protein
MLFSFLRDYLNEDFGDIDSQGISYVLEILLKKVIKVCEKKMILLLENINRELLEKLYFIILSYKDIFHLSDEFFIEIKRIIEKNPETIIIHPTIDDLFDNNLYKLTRNNRSYIIPLWHHELVYDNSGTDFIVKCFPILPDNIRIDTSNNIEMEIKWGISEIWDKTNLFIYIGCNTFYILREQLLIREYQTVRLYRKGISKINTRDVYDVSNKTDIILHIHLEL